MKVLIACEFSGIVTRAFRDKGHEAFSCDLLPTEGNPEWHYQMNVEELLCERTGFSHCDLLIAFPPCTHLAVSGARWFKGKAVEQRAAINDFMFYASAPIEKICVENPIGIMSTQYRKPDQIIQPWQFGHGETKATCLWLKNLPLLKSTEIVKGRTARVHLESPGPDRWKNRSRTLSGIASAMAEQWG